MPKFLINVSNRYYYAIKKNRGDLKIYYKLVGDSKWSNFFITMTNVYGNKRVNILKVLMRRNLPILTKESDILNPEICELEMLDGWIEIEESKALEYLRRGNPEESARKILTDYFGDNFFDLSPIELEYFKTEFSTLLQLQKFYRKIRRKHCGVSVGYIHQVYQGKTLIITPGKIRKAMKNIFGIEMYEK